MAPSTPDLSQATLESYAKTAQEVAREAGRLIKESLVKRESEGLTVEVKRGIDLVTEVDKRCEAVIMEKLKAKYPTHKYVGEETTFLEGSEEFTNDPTWVIDPLDGTTNFVHGYTFVAVSIGLIVDKIPVMGVIYNPILDEMYVAWKGGKARLNGTVISVGKSTCLNDALVVNNIGSSRDRGFILKTLYRLQWLLLNDLQALRMSGSAAQNLAHVACGRLDIYFEDGYGGPWDVAAGKILVEEAGGVVQSVTGEPFELKPGKGKLIAGNKQVVDAIVTSIRTADRMGLALRALRCISAACTIYTGLCLAQGALSLMKNKRR